MKKEKKKVWPQFGRVVVLGVSGEWLSPFTHQPRPPPPPPPLPTLQMQRRDSESQTFFLAVPCYSSQPANLPLHCASRALLALVVSYVNPPLPPFSGSPSLAIPFHFHPPKANLQRTNRIDWRVNKKAGSDRTCRRHVGVGKGSRGAGAPLSGGTEQWHTCASSALRALTVQVQRITRAGAEARGAVLAVARRRPS